MTFPLSHVWPLLRDLWLAGWGVVMYGGRGDLAERGFMNFREEALEMLTSRGMFDDQAAAVMERVMADKANEPMKGRWHDDVSNYPGPMLNILWLTVKRHAAEYIAETCPHAWFRPLFDEEAEARVLATLD